MEGSIGSTNINTNTNANAMSSSGVTVVGSDAPSDYHVAPRTTTDNNNGSSTATIQVATGSAAPPPQQAVVSISPPPGLGGPTAVKKKRGRPRKYGPDSSVAHVALSPKPISSSALPPVIDFSAVDKRGKVRSVGSVAAAPKIQQPRTEMTESLECESGLCVVESSQSKILLQRGIVAWVGVLGKGGILGLFWTFVGHFFLPFGEKGLGWRSRLLELTGELVSCSVGASFTPHIITVNAGEDVTMKVISFSQQGPRAICILSANGVISSVTLRQPDSSGGTLTYEGRFEILSLTGSFMPSETGGMRNRSGGMSVSLASPDGRVVGGGVAGLLIAASPVQIIVGSFLAGNQLEQKTKKQKPESTSIIPTAAIPISSAMMEDTYHTSTSFRGDSWSSIPPDSRNSKPTDINVSLPG